MPKWFFGITCPDLSEIGDKEGMLMDMIAVIGLCFTCFTIGYMLGKDINKK